MKQIMAKIFWSEAGVFPPFLFCFFFTVGCLLLALSEKKWRGSEVKAPSLGMEEKAFKERGNRSTCLAVHNNGQRLLRKNAVTNKRFSRWDERQRFKRERAREKKKAGIVGLLIYLSFFSPLVKFSALVTCNLQGVNFTRWNPRVHMWPPSGMVTTWVEALRTSA